MYPPKKKKTTYYYCSIQGMPIGNLGFSVSKRAGYDGVFRGKRNRPFG